MAFLNIQNWTKSLSVIICFGQFYVQFLRLKRKWNYSFRWSPLYLFSCRRYPVYMIIRILSKIHGKANLVGEHLYTAITYLGQDICLTEQSTWCLKSIRTVGVASKPVKPHPYLLQASLSMQNESLEQISSRLVH